MTFGTQMLPAAGVIELQETSPQPAPAAHSEARARTAQTRKGMAAFSTLRRGGGKGALSGSERLRLLLLSDRDCRRAVRPRRAPAMPSAPGRRRSAQARRVPSDKWKVRAPERHEAPRQAAARHAAERAPTSRRTHRGKAPWRARPATRGRTTANAAQPRRERTSRLRPDVRRTSAEPPWAPAAEPPLRPSRDAQAALTRRRLTQREDRSARPG